MNTINVSIETGQKRTFACAVDLPGWCRSGRDEPSALQALLDYGPRYARALALSPVQFTPPASLADLQVIARLPGNATTDFGSPGMILDLERQPLEPGELARLQAGLEACWQVFNRAVAGALGKELRKGPRGGGRDLQEVVVHVLEAEQAYLAKLGWKFQKEEYNNLAAESERTQEAIHRALAASQAGSLPERGPRGGVFWPPRYFIRRAAWHALDHAWEIEDRTAEGSQQ